MSSEQASGSSVDHRTDEYALGVILYECLVGRVPFEADTYMGVLTKHLFAVPEPIEQVAPEATRARLGALGMIAMRCLAKKPEDRHGSMDALAKALDRAARDPAGAVRAALGEERPSREPLRLREPSPVEVSRSSPPPPIPGLSRSRAWIAVVACAAVVLGVATAVVARPRPAEPAASPATAAASAPVDLHAAPPIASAPGSAASAPSSSAAVVASASAAATPTAPAPSHHASHVAPRPTRRSQHGEVVDPWAN
jgi:serine/threonine-protein kinase